jgi:hypothetical protein
MNVCLPCHFDRKGEISGGKVRDFSLSLEMTGNNVSSIFAHQLSRYFAKGSSDINLRQDYLSSSQRNS